MRRIRRRIHKIYRWIGLCVVNSHPTNGKESPCMAGVYASFRRIGGAPAAPHDLFGVSARAVSTSARNLKQEMSVKRPFPYIFTTRDHDVPHQTHPQNPIHTNSAPLEIFRMIMFLCTFRLPSFHFWLCASHAASQNQKGTGVQ